MLYCGNPDNCGALGGNEVTASVNDQHAVRCCTEDQSVGWPYKCTSALASLVYMASPTFHNAMALQHSLRLLISALLTLVAVFVQGMRCWIGAPEEQDVGSTVCWFGDALLMAMQKRVRQMLSVAVEIVMEVLAQHKSEEYHS